jgi:hypothetical protein
VLTNSLAKDRAITIKFPWMFDRNYDLFFFFISFFIGLLSYLLASSSIAASSALLAFLIPTSFGLGPFHQGPTWMSYFDAQNREWFRSHVKKRMIFFAGPPLIMVCSIAGMFFCKWLIIAIWLLWSIQHLVQQNVGILLLYHNHNRGEAVVDRETEIRSLHIAAVFFTLVMIRRLYFGENPSMILDGIVIVTGLATLFFAAIYISQLTAKIKAGAYLNMPALIFWILSILCMLPMGLLGKNFAIAFLAPVTWHWLQYIGLNFRLVKNKYVVAPENNTALPMAKPLLLFFGICFGVTAINLFLMSQSTVPSGSSYDLAKTAAHAPDQLINLFLGTIIGLALCHFFLDAFIWRFREAYPRQAILPYLKSKQQ